MASEIVGGLEELRRRHLRSAMVCTMSPLTLDGHATDAGMIWSEALVPVHITGMAMMGVSSPATIAGNLVVNHAETDHSGSLPALMRLAPNATMVCSRNCWPVVRDTLKKQPGVAAVTLAPQKEEVPIDNPLVTVTLNGSFDDDKAIAAIAAAGFAKATVEK